MMDEKSIKELEKMIIKKGILIFVIVGIICTTIGVAAGSYSARQINFTPSDNTWNVTNVSDAIDSIKFNKTADNYSAEEKVVGTWIDGRPIYQKTYNGLNFSVNGNNWLQTGIILDSSIDGIKNAIVLDNNTYLACFLVTYDENHQLVMHNGSARTNAQILTTITIQYTKSTDQVSN